VEHILVLSNGILEDVREDQNTQGSLNNKFIFYPQMHILFHAWFFKTDGHGKNILQNLPEAS
jgi:hypothetical protein